MAMAGPVPCKTAVSREMQVAGLKLYFEAVTGLGAFLEKRGTDLSPKNGYRGTLC